MSFYFVPLREFEMNVRKIVPLSIVLLFTYISFAYAQQGPTLGRCQDAQGNIVERVNVSGQACNGHVVCRPSNDRAPVAGPCPNGSGAMWAEDSRVVAVGTCQASGSDRVCNRCEPGLICALFTGYTVLHPTSGNCFGACGTSFQRGGNCQRPILLPDFRAGRQLAFSTLGAVSVF